MNTVSQELFIKDLVAAAKAYFRMTKKIVILSSNNFRYNAKYIFEFNVTNFMNLTGVISNLKPLDFFNKCFEEAITCDDFSFSKEKNVRNFKKKIRCLKELDTFFGKEIFVQENFSKNRVMCKVATSDNAFTIGFDGKPYCLYPKTIMTKNRLDCCSEIFLVRPIISKKR